MSLIRINSAYFACRSSFDPCFSKESLTCTAATLSFPRRSTARKNLRFPSSVVRSWQRYTWHKSMHTLIRPGLSTRLMNLRMLLILRLLSPLQRPVCCRQPRHKPPHQLTIVSTANVTSGT